MSNSNKSRELDKQETANRLAEIFQDSVYMADPDMADSPPAKLYSYGFDAGAEWADANPPKYVKELVEALEKYANPETHSIDKDGVTWYGDYFDYDTAREALAKYKAATGGQDSKDVK